MKFSSPIRTALCLLAFTAAEWLRVRRGLAGLDTAAFAALPLALLAFAALPRLRAQAFGRPLPWIFGALLALAAEESRIVRLCAGALGVCLAAGVNERLTERPTVRTDAARGSWIVGLYAFLSLCALWTLYFPYCDYPDTYNQWLQISGAIPYSDIHAIAHTLLLKVALKLGGGSYAPLVGVQLMLTALLYGCFARFLLRRGARLGWLLALIGCAVWLPDVNNVYVSALKDMPYALFLGFATLLMMKHAESPLSLRDSILLGLLLAGAALMRLNGMLPALLCLLFVLLDRRRVWKRALAAVCAFGLCFAGATGIAELWLKPEHPANGFSVSVFGAGLSAVAMEGGQMTPEQEERLNSLIPMQTVKRYYQSGSPRRLVWGRDLTFDHAETRLLNNAYIIALGEHKREVIELYLALFPCNAGLMLRVLWDGMREYLALYSPDFVQCHALWLWLTLLAACAGFRGRARMRWIALLPVLGNVASILISTVTNEARYMLPTFLLLPALLSFAALSPLDRSGEQAVQ
ncbi:MAG: hypothetical protein PHY12_02825 [Eubacteriales bacterium]|nr:hypothetical protein [Eubacteriales bacterium]